MSIQLHTVREVQLQTLVCRDTIVGDEKESSLELWVFVSDGHLRVSASDARDGTPHGVVAHKDYPIDAHVTLGQALEDLGPSSAWAVW